MDPTYLFTRYRDANGIDWALLPAVGATPEDIDRAAVKHFRDLAAARGGNALLAKRSDDGLGAPSASATTPPPRSRLAQSRFSGAPRRSRNTCRTTSWCSRIGGIPTKRTGLPPPVALILHALHEQRATLGPAFPLAINALTHRDYFQPGPVYVALEEEGGKKESYGQVARAIVLV